MWWILSKTSLFHIKIWTNRVDFDASSGIKPTIGWPKVLKAQSSNTERGKSETMIDESCIISCATQITLLENFISTVKIPLTIIHISHVFSILVTYKLSYLKGVSTLFSKYEFHFSLTLYFSLSHWLWHWSDNLTGQPAPTHYNLVQP